MHGWKKMALLTALSVAAGGVRAMDALPDDDLAAATGQAGISFTIDNIDLETSAVRYYDSDGLSASGISAYNLASGSPLTTTLSSSAPGPCASATNVQCAASFSAGGSLSMNAFSISNFDTSVTTTIDIGSTGTGATATSGLLLNTQLLSGLNINTGGISLDNGDELAGTVTGSRAPTNAATYDSNGVLTSGNDLGGLAITNVSSTNLVALVTPGAHALSQSSGLTLTLLQPLTMQFYFNYYNTSMQYFNGGEFTDTNSASTTGLDGIITVPVYIWNLLPGPVELAAGKAGSGYSTSAGQGLDIYSGGATATAIDFGGEAVGDSGIMLTSGDIGSVGIVGLKIGPQNIVISGH